MATRFLALTLTFVPIAVLTACGAPSPPPNPPSAASPSTVRQTVNDAQKKAFDREKFDPAASPTEEPTASPSP